MWGKIISSSPECEMRNMKSEDLLEQLAQSDSPFVQNRKESLHSMFLQLYANVGYAPTDSDREEWERQTVNTWKQVDRAVTNSCTGGFAEGKAISSCGTLPFSPKVVYGHSYCMEKSLLAAATLFKQSLGSLSWTERVSGVEFWAGSYKTKSAFTTRFQVLRPEIDCHQRRIFMVRFDPEPGSKSPSNSPFEIEELVRFADTRCTAAFSYLDPLISAPHSLMKGLHSVQHFGIFDRGSREATGHLVLHDSLPNLTAANVFRFAWLFLERWSDVSRVVPFLRQLSVLSNTGIQVVCEEENCKQFDLPGEHAVPSFWVFTPRALVPHLRESFKSAFGTVLQKYSNAELAHATQLLFNENIAPRGNVPGGTDALSGLNANRE